MPVTTRWIGQVDDGIQVEIPGHCESHGQNPPSGVAGLFFQEAVSKGMFFGTLVRRVQDRGHLGFTHVQDCLPFG